MLDCIINKDLIYDAILKRQQNRIYEGNRGMINWMYFPQNKKMEKHLLDIVDVFSSYQSIIDSTRHNKKSDDVLSIISEKLEEKGYSVEKSKNKKDKIRVPVLFGKNGNISLAFEVDAYSVEYQTVIEVEAGRAVANYQFLKDFYEACMMPNVKYCCIAVRNIYRNCNDFEKVCSFFQTLYISNKFQLPLNGILIIGY